MKLTRRQALKRAAAAAALAGLPFGARAAEKNEPERKLRIVIAGAHPDDPESACGGLTSLCVDAGHEVIHLYLTRGEAGIKGKTHEEAAGIRTAEAEKACKVLGAQPVFLSQVDGATEITPDRYAEVQRALVNLKPDVVVTHWPVDSHRDHRITSILVYDAWHHSGGAFDLYYFEVEAGDQTQLFRPTHYVNITSVEDRKREACYCHKSQNAAKWFYVLHTDMHRFRGKEAGVQFAEAYIRHCQSVSGPGLPRF